MAFPKLLQKLFQNNGGGSQLNPEIIPTDSALSTTSTNPIQNKAVNTALSTKADTSALASYLPLSGGTMTGETIYNYTRGAIRKANTEGFMCITAGSVVSLDGANSATLFLVGGTSGSFAEETRGSWTLQACQGTYGQSGYVSRTLSGYADGRLLLGKRPVIVLNASSFNSSTGIWYRKYSDGFIEQGGRIAKGSGLSYSSFWSGTVTFPTSFTDVNSIIVFITADFLSLTSVPTIGSGEEISTRQRTVTSFAFDYFCRNGTGTTTTDLGLLWYACGY